MPLPKPSSRPNFPEIEVNISQFWRDQDIFNKSVEQRPVDNIYSFVDGPPFVSGTPHYGSLLPSIAKDVIPRFQTMKGKRVRRVFGWDCHGLPVEEKISKKLGLKDRIEIETYGVDKYIGECRNYIQETTDQWGWYIDRVGRWVDMDKAYYTMNPQFNESVLWFFKQAWDKGLIYRGKRVSLFSTDNSTPVSEFEVNMDPDNYRDTDDLTIFVKFELKQPNSFLHKLNLEPFQKPIHLLAWTTTPWTIPSNSAVAVNPELDYCLVEFENQYFVLSPKRLEYTFQTDSSNIGGDAGKLVQILASFKGSDLLGLEYHPIYGFFSSEATDKDYKVYSANFVNDEDGTGLAHESPAYGREDYDLAREFGFSAFESIDNEGRFIFDPWQGIYLRDLMETVTADLEQKGNLFRSQVYKHRLPFYRGNNPLIYKAQDSYFIDIQSLKPRMLELNQQINWYPSHLKNGRFLDVITKSPDWCISRNRFWATIMPLWRNEDGDEIVIGSIADMSQHNDEIELREIDSVRTWFFRGQPLFLHRDVCDQIILTKGGKDYHRVTEVLDCWMDSGSVPFAEHHYPFENQQDYDNSYPADFIIEYAGQLRAWFNMLLRVAVIAFDSIPFKNAVVTGNVAGNDGRKMSKSFGNYPDPKAVLENIGGEALRLYLMSQPVMLGEDMNWSDEALNDQVKNILIPLWNTYIYFITYANLFDFQPTTLEFNSTNILDKWIWERMNQVTVEYARALENYNIPESVKLIQPCIDDISTWFIRRSRDRFAVGDVEAISTLYVVLVRFIKTFAPQMPFITEEMYQNLVVGLLPSEALESVHLELYPETKIVNLELLKNMQLVRDLASLGLKARSISEIKLRQPMQKVFVNQNLSAELLVILMQELNVKQAEYLPNLAENENLVICSENGLQVGLDTFLSSDLKDEGLLAEITRQIQNTRKNNGLEMGQLVAMKIWTEDEYTKTFVNKFTNQIQTQTALSEIIWVESLEVKSVKVEGIEIKIEF